MKKYVTGILIVLLSVTFSMMLVHQISKQTLLNKEWLIRHYEENNYFNQLTDAIHNNLSTSLYEKTGMIYKFKDIVSQNEIKAIMESRTEQLLLSERTHMQLDMDVDLTTYVNRINDQLSLFVITDMQKYKIINQFNTNMKGHFFMLSQDAKFDPQVNLKLKSFELINFINRKVIFYSSTVLNLIALVSLYLIHRRRLSELMTHLCASFVFSGINLFLLFVYAHNLYFNRANQTVLDIKYTMLFTILNDVFKVIYMIGYYVVITGVILYVIIFSYRNLKNYYIEI